MPGTGFTVGRLPFLISMPYFHLDVGRGRFRTVEGSPAEINAALAAGRVHAAPSSSFEALRHSDLYSLVPEVCTSGFDSVGSALLFSMRPWEELSGTGIAATPQSESAAALLRLLLRHDGLECRVETREPRAGDEAVLLIGDRALEWARDARWPFRTDLCTRWWNWKRLPFVFGAWMVRREWAGSAELRAWRELLLESVASFRADPDAAVARWSAVHPVTLPKETLDAYWPRLAYRMGPDHVRALEEFGEEAFAAGLLTERPSLRWLPPLPRPA